jgi:hypothetical protein
MNRRRLCPPTLLAAALLAGAGAAPAIAHHSFAAYEKDKTLTLNGSVKDFVWVNPHVLIWILAQPPPGPPKAAPELWSIETTSPGVLTRSGWSRTSLKPGDHVTVEFNPLRDGSHGGGLTKITLKDTGQVLVPSFTTQDPAKPK